MGFNIGGNSNTILGLGMGLGLVYRSILSYV